MLFRRRHKMNEKTNEQASSQFDAPQERKMPFYKKWWMWAIAAFVIFALAFFGSGGGTVQDDLIDYINQDMLDIAPLDEEVHELYEKARTSENDYTFYLLLDEQVLPRAKKLTEDAEAISPKTKEVRALHEIYIDAVNTQFQAMTLIMAALESQDYVMVTNANEKLDESRKLYREYQTELEKLMDKHDVEFN